MIKKQEEFLKHIYFVILCGGGGTRLWPRSRDASPKQFVNLTSQTHTLYQNTVKRIKEVVSPNRIFIITNKKYVRNIKEETPFILTKNIIAEPEKKNTALAMGVAAAYIYKRDPEAVIVNLASDHTIEDVRAFVKTVLAAAKEAFGKSILATVGINPTFPHTGFGYIRVGEKLRTQNGLPVFDVRAFTEKPKLAIAKKFLASGEYFWNANFYTWSAKACLDAFQRHSPTLYGHIMNIYKAIGTNKEKEVLVKEYAKAPEEQIDTAISEKADNLVMLPGNFGWNDVGDWRVVYDLAKKDKEGNAIIESSKTSTKTEVVLFDSKNNFVHYNEQLVVLVGVENLLVVDTGNVLLVCHKDRAQDVKKVVNLLKKGRKKEFL